MASPGRRDSERRASSRPAGAPRRPLDDLRTLILWTIVVTSAAVVVVWCLYLARGALLLIYVSVLFAIGISPLVRSMERQRLLPVGSRRMPRAAAILTIYLAVVTFLTGIGALAIPPLVQQARELWTELPQHLGRLEDYLIEWGVLQTRLQPKDVLDPNTATDVVGSITAAISSVVGGIFGLFIILILTFYILLEAKPLFEGFLKMLPPDQRTRTAEAGRKIAHKVSAWMVGQILVSAFIGVTAAIGLGLLGVPYFYVLALIAAIGELIPVLGPLLAAIPGIALAATVSFQLAAIVAVFYIVQQQFESHVLVPKLMEHQVGLSAATVLTALLIGGSLAGIAGAILAIPTAAVLQVVLQELIERRPPDGPSRAD